MTTSRARLSVSCFAALCLATLPLAASEEEIIQPHRASITADCGAAFGTVRVEMAIEPYGAAAPLRELVLHIGGKALRVPDKAFAGLQRPLLSTLELRQERGYDKHPWLYVTFEDRPTVLAGKWLPRRVYIAYQDGRFVHRGLKWRAADGQWKYEATAL